MSNTESTLIVAMGIAFFALVGTALLLAVMIFMGELWDRSPVLANVAFVVLMFMLATVIALGGLTA